MVTKQLDQMRIPEIGLGTHQYRAGAELLRQGFQAGALLVDTAESYGSEPVVGEALKGWRDRVFLATKVSASHYRGADLLRAADASLLRLGTDRIDLYQLHEPSLTIPIEETMGGMEDLVDAGKVRYIGVSNFSASQMTRAQQAMRKHRIAANQVRYNLVDRSIEGGLLEYCQKNRVLVIAYSPLARGMPFILDGDPGGVLLEVARQTGKTPAQVALNWCIRHEHVVAIPRGNSTAHVLENCAASGWRLNAEQIRMLTEKVAWRRRHPVEVWLRRLLPPSLKHQIARLAQKLPQGLRRKIN